MADDTRNAGTAQGAGGRGAVAVIRVSTGHQAKEGTSPETQRAQCRAKASDLGVPIVAEYFDAGVSGAFLASRDGMQAALADIRAGRADTLIVPNMDRYSRDEEHQHAIRKAVHAAGGRIVFCDAEYEDSPEGDLNFTIQGGFAAYERKRFRKRSMDGKAARAEAGLQPCRTLPPFGYHVPTRDDVMRGAYPLEQLGRYVIVEEQARVVRRIFGCYADGAHSLHALCRELNAEGVPTPKGAASWRAASVRAILANPVHKGMGAYGKVRHRMDETRLQAVNPLTGRPYTSPVSRQTAAPEDWIMLPAPAIVTADVWERAQARTARNRAQKGGQPARVQMLSGLVRCPACGGGMRYEAMSRGGRRYRYYKCHAHVEGLRDGASAACEGVSYGVDAVEAVVAESLMAAAERPGWVRASGAAYRGVGSGVEDRGESVALERALADLARDEAAAVLAQIAGIRAGAPPDAYTAVFAGMAARRKELEGRARVLGKAPARPRISSGREGAGGRSEASLGRQALADLRKVLASPHVTAAHKRDLIGMVVDRVICDRGGARVVYRKGASEEAPGDDGHPHPRQPETVPDRTGTGSDPASAAGRPCVRKPLKP